MSYSGTRVWTSIRFRWAQLRLQRSRPQLKFVTARIIQIRIDYSICCTLVRFAATPGTRHQRRVASDCNGIFRGLSGIASCLRQVFKYHCRIRTTTSSSLKLKLMPHLDMCPMAAEAFEQRHNIKPPRTKGRSESDLLWATFDLGSSI